MDAELAEVGVVIDSAIANVGVKTALSLLYPTIIFVACFAHQRHVLTETIIGHQSLSAITGKCSLILSFFKRSTKYMGLMQEIIDLTMEQRLTFIKTRERRWYTHFGQRRRLLDLKPALERFANGYFADVTVLRTTKAAAVVGELRIRAFWGRVEVVADLVLPIVKEGGLVERRSSVLEDTAAAFGRLHAYFSQVKVDSATLGADGATAVAQVVVIPADTSVRAITNRLCMTILTQLHWRLTLYCSAALLLSAHVFDPSRGVTGLRTRPGGCAAFENIVRIFVALASRFGALPRGGGQDEQQQNCDCQAVRGV